MRSKYIKTVCNLRDKRYRNYNLRRLLFLSCISIKRNTIRSSASYSNQQNIHTEPQSTRTRVDSMDFGTYRETGYLTASLKNYTNSIEQLLRVLVRCFRVSREGVDHILHIYGHDESQVNFIWTPFGFKGQ